MSERDKTEIIMITPNGEGPEREVHTGAQSLADALKALAKYAEILEKIGTPEDEVHKLMAEMAASDKTGK